MGTHIFPGVGPGRARDGRFLLAALARHALSSGPTAPGWGTMRRYGRGASHP
jgi:hypothetical protein